MATLFLGAAAGAQVPQAAALPPGAQERQDPGQSGSLLGVVEDTDGNSIAGAHVVLSTPGASLRSLTISDEGEFVLDNVPPGPFTLAVSAEGFAPSTVSGNVRAGEKIQLSTIVLEAGAVENVDVTVSKQEVALQELHEEEHQRIGGIIPNFFVVYDFHAPPLTTRQKYVLSAKTIVDPATLFFTAGLAGINQADDALSGYGPGPAGYGKRLGAGLADQAIGTMIGGAILPSLFHQDPRYLYKGTGSIHSRLFYALASGFICRGDNGKWQFSYSSVGGDLAAGAIANLYYPATDRDSVGVTLRNGFVGVGLDGVQNVIQEFLIRHLTPHLPPVGH